MKEAPELQRGLPGCIVTGGASGIGRAICLRLATDRAVGVLDRDEAGARETVRLIKAQGGIAVPLHADVANATTMEQAFQTFEQQGFFADAVVACAGVERLGTVLDEAEENWDFVMNVNAKGVYLTAKAAYKRFVAHRTGSFVVISSDAGLLGTNAFGIYTASKHAVVGLVKCLALDFGHLGIRSNVVCPGNVATPMMEQALAEAPEEAAIWLGLAPMGRFAKPDEIAACVQFLASPAASYINGSEYVVDGGGASVGLFHADAYPADRHGNRAEPSKLMETKQ